MKYDTIILGAGGAGLMCAITAGNRGRKVLLIDHAKDVGAKILISGGGRCNFTNMGAGASNYRSNNPHFCKSALSRYTSADFIKLVQKYKVPYHEKKLGQLFTDNQARDIVDLLLAECNIAGVHIKTSCSIQSIDKTIDNNLTQFTVRTNL